MTKEQINDLYIKVWNLWTFTFLFDSRERKENLTKKDYIKEYNLLRGYIAELQQQFEKIILSNNQ